MPKDRDKYFNVQKIFTSYELQSLMKIKFEVIFAKLSEMESNNPTLKENLNLNWTLMKERKRLLDLAKQESNKPPLPSNLYFKEKEKFFALKVNSYLFIYLKELMCEIANYQKPIRKNGYFVANTERGMHMISKDDIMRLLRIYIKKYQILKNLEHLQFTDKLEAEEINYAVELQIIISYLISKYTSQMIKGFDVIINEQKVTIKRPDFNQLEAQLDNYALIDSILREIISISTSLQDKELSEEVREDYVQSRKKLRQDIGFVLSYEMWRSRQNGEDYENFVEEYRGVHNVLRAFLKLNLNQAFLKEFFHFNQAFLKESQVDGIQNELYDILKSLREIDLTTEGRKYFLEREVVVEKEVEDWEGKMKEFLADFPYSPHEFITLRGNTTFQGL